MCTLALKASLQNQSIINHDDVRNIEQMHIQMINRPSTILIKGQNKSSIVLCERSYFDEENVKYNVWESEQQLAYEKKL